MKARRQTRVAVIGGGLGGMSAAVSLAAKGYPVSLFERNEALGGKAAVKLLQGFSFDLGPSILILPDVFRRLFARAGRRLEDYLRLTEVIPQWRCFFEDGTRFDLHPDVRLMEAELARIGASGDDYFGFLSYSKRLYRFADDVYFERGADTLREVLLSGHGPRELERGSDYFSTVHDGVSRFVRNRYLRDTLAFFVKYVGSSSFDAPAILNLMPYAQLAHGLWYPEGGFHGLVSAVSKLLDELGVEVHLGEEVVEVRVEGGKVAGFATRGGRSHRADVVVSNMEVVPFTREVLRAPERERARLAPFQPSCSGLVLHLGVDRTYPQLAHHNFFFTDDARRHFDQIHREKVLPDDPTLYVVAPARTDPRVAPEGMDVIKVLPHIPHLTDSPPSPGDYLALEDRVLAKLERMGLEGLRAHVVIADRMLPADLERRYRSNRGSIYGVVSDRKLNKGFKAPKRSRTLSNLYFVGGSVNPGGGTPMVTLGGMQVSDLVARDHPG